MKLKLSVPDANVRLYGTSEDSKGNRDFLDDKITISPPKIPRNHQIEASGLKINKLYYSRGDFDL